MAVGVGLFPLQASAAFSYAKTIDLTGSSGAGTNYVLPLVIKSGTDDAISDIGLDRNASVFPHDIAFFDNDGTTALDHWIEDSAADPITIWVEVKDDLGSAQSIVIKYGDSGVTTLSNGANTFPFFDDFESYTVGTLPSPWTIRNNANGGSISVQADPLDAGNKIMKMWNSSSGSGWRAVTGTFTAVGTSTALHWKRYESGSGRHKGGLSILEGATHIVSNLFDSYYPMWDSYSGSAYVDFSPDLDSTYPVSGWHKMVDTVIGSEYTLDYDGTAYTGIQRSSQTNGIDNFYFGSLDTDTSHVLGLDDVFVRKVVDPEPNVLNLTPVVSSITFSGTANVGQLQTGSYTYADADNDLEGTSTFRWLRDDVVINGATSQTYTTVSADVETTLKFEITPVAATGETPGIAVESSGTAIVNLVPSDITISSQTVNSNSPIGTTVGTLSATDGDAEATFTFTISSGVGCTASDNTKFTISGTELKIAEATDFYTKSSYTVCVQVADQYNDTYRENFEILIPIPETVTVPSSVTGESTLPDVPRIILDEEKIVDLSAATTAVSDGDRDVSIGGTTFNLEAYTAGSLNGANVKESARINVQQATRISTAQVNLVLTHTETPGVELRIPDQTVVFGESNADFLITPPVNTETTNVTNVPSGFTVEKSVSVGSTTETYVFDTPVVVVFNNAYDRILMRLAGASSWENISQCSGTFASPTMPSFPESCWIADKSIRQTSVYTFHLTEFGGLLENNYGSGKQALFYEGMKRSDIRQSGYGTDKKTFADSYKLSLAEAEMLNQGKSGIAQFITTTWENNKFLRYISGRTSVAYQRSIALQQVKYRISNNRELRPDIQLVIQQRNKNTFLASAPKKNSLQEKFNRIAKIFRPRGVPRKRSSQPKTRASSRISTSNMTLRTRDLVDRQKKRKQEASKNYFSSAPKIEKPLSRIQQYQNERFERSLLRIKRPQSKGVLRHLQNNLFLFANFLKTSLFDMADILSTNLFKTLH